MSIRLPLDAHELQSVGVDPQLVRLVQAHCEDGYRLYLETLRWPAGARCPRCDSQHLLWIERRSKYNCYGCRYQFRVTAGTLLHDSHVPLWKWLLAVSLMLSAEDGLPATQMHRVIGGSYKTAWFIEHRIRAAMAQRPVSIGPLVAFAGDHSAAQAGRARSDARSSTHAEAPRSLHLLQQILAGPYRNLSVKHLAAYWNELRWRDAHHASPSVFRDTVSALLDHEPVPYSTLVAGDAPTHPLRKRPTAEADDHLYAEPAHASRGG